MVRSISLLFILALVTLGTFPAAAAESLGTAGGRGTIGRPVPSPDPPGWTLESVSFEPKVAHAYRQGDGSTGKTWIVLTAVEPPLAKWKKVEDRSNARIEWCQETKQPFVAIELDASGTAELLEICPGEGLQTEMVSTTNGLASVVVTLEPGHPGRLVGSVRGGELGCSEAGDDGGLVWVYCEVTEDYTFDVPLE